ncbi:uncharacterized protein LOC128556219 [Mercenaria mercenaria]|uniref:uncharacterized protein LOC128556219 n=1 Tax=Mercenaria mercenaria TaxID=6596 RepID=UPI00234F2093|nr:uncharacterized protein LOC128556219 [Mercenaria mercenaria]
MPTSSQAMILRSTDSVRSPAPMVSYKFITPLSKVRTSYQDATLKLSPPPTSLGGGERVQFDISVCANHDLAIDGFEGVFAYDQKTKSYRWQLFTVSPNGRTEFTIDKHESGDYANEETSETGNYIMQQSSECNGHFTTPAESLVDFDQTHKVSPRGEFERMDDAAYRRLEELGFRRRTACTPGGSLAHVNQVAPIVRKKPQKSSSAIVESNRVPKLPVRNLDRDITMKPKNTPKDTSYFPPRAFVCGESMKRRAQPTKQKSLLEEVKESVNWANRVTPSTHLKNAPRQNLKSAVCFSLRDSWKYDHVQVKRLVETQIQCEVKTLQFDPVSVRSADGSVLDRWIVTFGSNRDCSRAVENGLSVDGDKVVVRSWDEIVREEYCDDWEYPCNYRLSSAKHERALRKFLQVH